MSNYQIIAGIFSTLMIIRFLLNFPKYLFLKKALHKQDIFVKANFKDSIESDVENGKQAVKWLEENQIEIEKTVLNTGLPNQSKSYMAPMGLGYAQSKKIPVLSNLTYDDSEIQEAARAMLNRSKGQYKR